MNSSRSAKIGAETVNVSVEAGLEKYAEWLLGVFADMATKGRPPEDGRRLQIGWTAYTLRRQPDGALHVFEPDFLGDAFKAEKLGATESLKLQGVQLGFADRLGVTPEVTAFHEKVIFEKGSLSAEDIYMTRVEPNRAESDSGWFIGVRRAGDTPQELEGIPAYQLLQRRPELFAALILPAGCIVVASKAGIETVVDGKSKVIFDRKSVAI
jgi:hypothetical protein